MGNRRRRRLCAQHPAGAPRILPRARLHALPLLAALPPRGVGRGRALAHERAPRHRVRRALRALPHHLRRVVRPRCASPALCGERGGADGSAAHFSENWGFLSLAPLFGGNAFSLAFGADVDAHAAPTPAPGLTIRGGAASDAVCTLGAACYARSVRLTAGAAALALALSVWAGVRDRRKAAAVEAEVLWDEEDDE
jgi:hypothetical protein